MPTASEGGLPELADVVENLGFGWGHVKALILGGGVWLADGAELLLIGSVTRAVNVEWNLNAMQRGMIVSVVFIGVLVGNLFSGHLGDLVGRRFPVVISYAGVLIFSVVSIFAWDFYTMASIRFVVGISFGIGQPAWCALGGEISPSNRRMQMNGYGQILFAVGEFYSAALIWWSDPAMKHLDWRWLIGMGAIPSGIFLVLAYFFLVESPSFLAIHGRQQEAKQVLENIRGDNGLPESLSVDFQIPRRSQTANSGVMSNLGIVLGPSMLYTTVVTGFSCFTLNFLFYGGLYGFPQVLPDIDIGISPAAGLMVGAVMEVPGYIFGIFVGVNLTRKLGIQFYLIGVCLSTLVFAYAAGEAISHNGQNLEQTTQFLLQAGFIGNKVFTSVGFIIVYCYSMEIYATVARATGTAVCLAMGRVGSITCPVVYELLKESTGSPLTFFYLMVVSCAVNSVLVFFLKLETFGKKLKDVDDDETTPLAH